jgi:MSHA pilin protein MshA
MPPRQPRRQPRRPRGFSLIEQLVVIALVGTASATALPALVVLKQRADDSLLDSLAASAGTAMLLNQAGCLVTDQQAAAGKCQWVRDCADVAGLLRADLPPGYRVPAQPLAATGSVCRLQRLQDGRSAAFHAAATGGS